MTEQALDEHLNQLSEDEEAEKWLKYNLKQLATIRVHLADRQEELSKAHEALEATPEQELVNEIAAEINNLKQAETLYKDNITKDALFLSELSEYEDRKPASGVQIKEFTTIEILDEKKAKVWASENAPDTISISKAKFNKIAKVLNLDFVEIGTEYRAQVASDLSNYLDE